MNPETRKGREKRVLAKPLVQGGQPKAPGDEVWLRPDQIERLAPGGFFKTDEPAPAPETVPAKGGAGKKTEAKR